jgi:Fe-S cluster assembly protein SufD
MTAPVARRGFNQESVTELVRRRDEPEWLRERRLAAWKLYTELPMPTRGDEEWRRTDIRGLHLDEIQSVGIEGRGSKPSETMLPAAERNERYGGFLGLRDGEAVEYQLDEGLRARGVIFTDLATAVREYGDLVRDAFMTRCVPPSDGKFAALHAAFWQNGTFLYVPAGVSVEEPLRSVISASMDGVSSLIHTLIVLERGASATFAESFASDDEQRQGFSSRVVELILGPESTLRYTGVQHWGRAVYDLHTERGLLESNSTLILQTVELGSHVSKGRVETILRGDGVNTKMQGLYVEDGDQHLDRYTLQDHYGKAGTSDLLFKGVLTDKARSVFSGLIRVAPGASRTAAYQQNRNLTLSRTARADSIPNLEIACNDIVGCSHGATVGKVDEEQIFYLMCRGLSRSDATHLIVEGFVDPLVEAVPIAGLRDTLRREIQARVGDAPAD